MRGLVAEILNRLARNPPTTLIAQEADCLRRAAAEKNQSPAAKLKKKLAHLHSKLEESERELGAVRRELAREKKKLAEMEENPFGFSYWLARAKFHRRVSCGPIAWEEPRCESLAFCHLELSTDQKAILDDPDKQERVVAWKADAVKMVENELEGLREQERKLAASELAEEDSEGKIPETRNLDSGDFDFASDFRLFFSGAEDEKWLLLEAEEPSCGAVEHEPFYRRARLWNAKEFCIRLLPGGERITSPKAFLEGIASGAAALYTCSGGDGGDHDHVQSRTMDRQRSYGHQSVPKHNLEVSFSRKARQDRLLVLCSGDREAEEEGKVYYPVWESGPQAVVSDAVLNVNPEGSFQQTLVEVPDHYLVIRASNGPLQFHVAFSECGRFHGVNCSPNL
eukprot:g9750.t1